MNPRNIMDIVLWLLLTILISSCIINLIDYTRKKTDNKPHIHTAPLRVYQIEIESQDTFSVWDGNRLVKKFFLTDDTEIGNMIIYDQE